MGKDEFQTIKVKLPGVEERERCGRILRPSSQEPGETFRLQTEEKVHAGRQEVSVSKMLGFSKQRAWTRWETCYTGRSLQRIVYCTLPIPANLQTLAKTETPSCLHVLVENPCNISSAAAPKPWLMVFTTGATNRCSSSCRNSCRSPVQSSKRHPRKKHPFPKGCREPPFLTTDKTGPVVHSVGMAVKSGSQKTNPVPVIPLYLPVPSFFLYITPHHPLFLPRLQAATHVPLLP